MGVLCNEGEREHEPRLSAARAIWVEAQVRRAVLVDETNDVLAVRNRAFEGLFAAIRVYLVAPLGPPPPQRVFPAHPAACALKLVSTTTRSPRSIGRPSTGQDADGLLWRRSRYP